MSRIKRETIEEQGVISHKDMHGIVLDFGPTQFFSAEARGKKKKKVYAKASDDPNFNKNVKKKCKGKSGDRCRMTLLDQWNNAHKAEQDAAARAAAAEKARLAEEAANAKLIHTLSDEYLKNINQAQTIVQEFDMTKKALSNKEGNIVFGDLATKFKKLATIFDNAEKWLVQIPDKYKFKNLTKPQKDVYEQKWHKEEHKNKWKTLEDYYRAKSEYQNYKIVGAETLAEDIESLFDGGKSRRKREKNNKKKKKKKKKR